MTGMTTAELADRPTSLSELERAVLHSIVYSDVFDYPVTAPEARRGLALEATLEEVAEALRVSGLFSSDGSYFALAGREALFPVRRRRETASRALMRRARSYGRAIARLPFVRMAAVTGSLAVDNAEAGDDIDYLIVTEPGRLWFTRTLIMVVVRLAALRGDTLCPNYILSASALALNQRDTYTARELVQMAPVAGYETYARMLAENAWYAGLLPNAEVQPPAPALPSRRNRLRDAVEGLLRARPFDAIEGWLMRRKTRELRAQAGANPETQFDATVCKGHFDGYHRRTEEAIALRLQQLGVSQP
jgi:hypothetical protein